MRRLIVRLLLIAAVVAVFVLAYCWILNLITCRDYLDERSTIEWERRGYGAMPDGPEKREFLRLLRKHGPGQPVIYGDGEPYYIRAKDGKRCAFR